MYSKKDKIYPAYVSNITQIMKNILLTIPSRERWHYLAVKNYQVCKNDFFKVIMSSEDTKILEFNQYENMIKHHLLFMHILNV